MSVYLLSLFGYSGALSLEILFLSVIALLQLGIALSVWGKMRTLQLLLAGEPVVEESEEGLVSVAVPYREDVTERIVHKLNSYLILV